MGLLRLVCEHFVAPADDPHRRSQERFVSPGEDPDGACAAIMPRTPPGVALLCAPADAFALGGALGLLLAGHHRVAAAAVCVWAGGRPARTAWRAPALPAARRLARGLAARGHEATGGGRLAVVRLPAGCEEAAAEARRVLAVAASAGGAPTVLALGGPRAAVFDTLLTEQDLVVVATRSSAAPVLARLAVEGLAAEAVCACACEVPGAPPARALAEAGLLLLPSARRALAGPSGAMS